MWKQQIVKYSGEMRFFPPATKKAITRVEEILNVNFPPSLISLLSESNGVLDEYGLGLVWDLERIEQENSTKRKNQDFVDHYMPFHHLLLFGDAGNGDLYAFSIINGKIQRKDVYAWNHEDDSRMWVAASLEIYIEKALTGDIKL